MMKLFLRAGVSVALALAFSATARAGTISYDITGLFEYGNFPGTFFYRGLPPAVVPMTGSFSYDDTTIDGSCGGFGCVGMQTFTLHIPSDPTLLQFVDAGDLAFSPNAALYFNSFGLPDSIVFLNAPDPSLGGFDYDVSLVFRPGSPNSFIAVGNIGPAIFSELTVFPSSSNGDIVPEPSTLLLVGTGLAATRLRRRLRRQSPTA